MNRFGHIISDVPPPLVLEFATSRDEAFASTFALIQQATPSDFLTHSLLVGAGGASITSLAKHDSGIYLGAFFRCVAGPLHQRLIAMGGATNRSIVVHLANLSGASIYIIAMGFFRLCCSHCSIVPPTILHHY